MATETRTKLLAYAEDLEHGRLNLTEVGAAIGVSREWVRQLCCQLKIDYVFPHVCKKCHIRLPFSERDNRYCTSCQPAPWKPKGVISICAECDQVYVLFGRARDYYLRNKKNKGTKKSRCPTCRERARGFREIITILCSVCGAEIQRPRFRVQRSAKLGRLPHCVRCKRLQMDIGRKASIARRGDNHHGA